MKNLLVFGNGNISKILSSYLEQNFNIVAYVAFKKFIKSKNFNNKPLIDAERVAQKYSPKKYKFITAIGYIEMNDVRKKIYSFLKSKGYKFENFIQKDIRLPKNFKIGENNILLENVSINPESIIGNGNIFWSNSVVSHNVKIMDFNWISSGTIISGESVIGNKNFFGSNSIISNNSYIENNVFLGAGTINSGKIKSNSTIISSTSKKIVVKSIDFLKYKKYER